MILKEKIKVLYIDDEQHNLTAFKTNFRRNFDVHLALSGKEALEIVRQKEINVIISDQRMPEMTGVEFFEIIRKEQPDPVRILLTGFADIEAVVNAINKGGVHSYISKPWDENDLRIQILNAFELFDLRDRNERLFRQYEQVFRGSTDPIFIVKSNGDVLDFNKATAELFKYSKRELMELNFLELVQTENFGPMMKEVLKDSDHIKDMDLTFRNKNGDLIDCIVSAKRISSGLRRADKFQGIIKDITERRAEEKRIGRLNEDLERRVAHRTRQLREAIKDLGSFSYTVAHDLRSPLKSVMAMISILDDHVEQELDDQGRELVARMESSSRKMLQLVDDLLKFAQLNQKEMESKKVDLNQVLHNVVKDMEREHRDEDVKLDIKDLPTIQSDAGMMFVVFTNLLSNACKFTRGTPTPEISIGYNDLGESNEIFVKDNGAGFDERRADQIFGAFKRLHREDEFEGSGIGLAIVERIVKKHGGTVRAKGEVGKGATIFLEFPKKLELIEPLPF